MKKIISSLLVAGVLASCSPEEMPRKTVHIAPAISGHLAPQEKTMVTIEGAVQSNLAFKAPGRIADIRVRVGQKVQAGDILATLSNEESTTSLAGLSQVLSEMSAVSQGAQLSVEEIRKMRIAVSDAADEQISLAETTLKKAKIGEEAAKKEYDLALSSLGGTISTISQTQETLRKNVLSSLAAGYAVVRNTRSFLDGILGITDENRSKNDNFEHFLGAKDSTTLQQAKNTFVRANDLYLATEQEYKNTILGKTPSTEQIDAFATRAEETLSAFRDTLTDMGNLLEASISSESSFPEAQLQGFKTQNTTLVGALENVYVGQAGIRTLHRSFMDFLAGNIGGETKSERETKTMVSLKKDQYEGAKVTREEAEKAVELTKKQVAAKMSEIGSQLSQAQSQARSAGAQKAQTLLGKNLAHNALESGIIRAPFSGVILARMGDVGDVVGAGQPIMSIAQAGEMVTRTYIENARWKITPSDILSVLADDGISATGSVRVIAKESDILSKKNYLEVSFSENSGLILWSRVALMLQEKSDTHPQIIIPSASLVGIWSVPSVFTLSGNVAQMKYVQILADDGNRIAVQGIMSGEQIITEGKDRIKDGDLVEIVWQK